MTDIILSRAQPRPGRGIGRIRAAFIIWRERRTLAGLDDHILRDIGLDRESALREANRKLWDAPTHWSR